MCRECPYLCKPQCYINEDKKIPIEKVQKFKVVKMAILFKFKEADC